MFPGEVDAVRFDEQMSLLRDHCQPLSLEEAVAGLTSGSLPPRAVAVTFDDGYADNAAVALPILQRHGIRATFFVAPGFLDGGRMWNDSVIEAVRRAPAGALDLTEFGLGILPLGEESTRGAVAESLIRSVKHLPQAERQRRVDRLCAVIGAELPRDLMMTSAEVRQLADAGMEDRRAHTHASDPAHARPGARPSRRSDRAAPPWRRSQDGRFVPLRTRTADRATITGRVIASWSRRSVSTARFRRSPALPAATRTGSSCRASRHGTCGQSVGWPDCSGLSAIRPRGAPQGGYAGARAPGPSGSRPVRRNTKHGPRGAGAGPPAGSRRGSSRARRARRASLRTDAAVHRASASTRRTGARSRACVLARISCGRKPRIARL